MASFIGSNLQSLHYNFKHKVAGSTVENPLKIYSGSVNPSNLPAPTSNEWKEIKNQNFIDRLGQQDGNTVVETTSNSVLGNIVSTNAPVDGMMNIEIGGNTLKNEVINGDFSNGTTGWETYTVDVISATNNEVVTTSKVTRGRLYYLYNFKNGNKYYVSSMVKSNSDLVALDIDSKKIMSHSGSGKYELLSGIFVSTVDLEMGLSIRDYRESNWDNVYQKSFVMINLTSMFGAGNEPTKEWCDANIPYFDGIKSVGEAEGNKIEVLTTGKNLCNYIYKENTYIDFNGNFITQTGFRTTEKIRVKPNAKYVLSGGDRTTIRIEDINGNKIFSEQSSLSSRTITTTSNAYNIYVYFSSNGTHSIFQLEEGTTATPYEPYREDKINILTSEPLRGLPNGVRDVVSGDSVERKIGKTILDGSESWFYYSAGQSLKTDVMTFCTSLINKKAGMTIINDKFPSGFVSDWDKNVVMLSGHTTNTNIYINCPKNYLTTQDLAGFKAWLQANPITIYYELATPTIEKLPQPLTLQSFKSGTLQVNTNITPYIKEWHTTNSDDNGVMQYMSGTTGLSQAFLTQIPLTSITNDIFGGSLPALKSAYKLTSNCDISAYGSGNNNGVESNNVTYKAWNGTEYVLLNTNTSNVVSNINNILNNSNYVVDNNIYILMHTLPASDTIKSQINLDYLNANIDIARQPDNVIIPDTVKNTYIPTNYTVFAKVACLKTNNKKVISQYFKDTNNYIELNIENNKINFVKCINGVITTLSSNILDYNKYQVVGVVAQQQNTGMKLSVLKNNGECEHFSNTDVNLLNVATEWKLGQDINIINQLDGFVVDYQFMAKTFTVTECEIMLKGRNITSDITYDGFVKDYQNGKIASGFILPNNKYKVTGQAKLYYNTSYTRMVENCEFVAKDDENKIELIGMAELVRVD